MVTHLFHLLGRAFGNLPNSLGSNWLGLVFPFIVFIITGIIVGFYKGWDEMKKHWGENLVLGFAVAGAAWFCLFLWCIVTTTYEDHMDLGKRTKELVKEKRDSVGKAEEEKGRFLKEVDSLKVECATNAGVNRTLQEQNRSQQITINGCLSQAIKLITPEQLKVTVLLLDKQDQNVALRQIRYLILTNKSMPVPMRLLASCEKYVDSAHFLIMGSSVSSPSVNKISPGMVELYEGIAQWGPQSPLIATVNYRGGGDDPQCKFTPR